MVVIENDGDGRNIIHTGDFRMCDAIRHDNTLCRLASGIHELYVDATFNVRWLPTKHHSIDMLKELIRQHHDRDIILHSHGLGDEEIIASIAEEFEDRRIAWWNQARRKLFSITHTEILRDLERCSTSGLQTGGFIHIVKNHGERIRNLSLIHI